MAGIRHHNGREDVENDSDLFRTRKELEEQEGAYPVGGNLWRNAAGDWVPLYEGKMVQAFDHRAPIFRQNRNSTLNAGGNQGCDVDDERAVSYFLFAAAVRSWTHVAGDRDRKGRQD
jgi:hypothetical protein